MTKLKLEDILQEVLHCEEAFYGRALAILAGDGWGDFDIPTVGDCRGHEEPTDEDFRTALADDLLRRRDANA